ncbi:uncharacterized protein LOC128204477 [Mya arenaria]|uniref:uncharacterized protein LOC128204477 n=1 Tax=Mya arenaria TaxID=6604 RepID=UPI0022DFBB57|nr:uncharacterized protein LOC128204477 [Mya arenaria]
MDHIQDTAGSAFHVDRIVMKDVTHQRENVMHVKMGGALECNQMDGHCTLGCGNGYKQTNTGCIDDQMNQNGGAGHGTSGSVIGGAVGGVFGLLTVALIIGLLIIVRRRRQDSTDGPKTDAAEESSVVYQNTSASAGIYNELKDKMDEAKPSKGHVNNAKGQYANCSLLKPE